MKRYIQVVIVTLLILSTNFLSAQEYRGEVLIRNNSLMEKDDTLYLSMDVLVKRNSVVDYAAMRIAPKIVNENNVQYFSDLLIQGNNKRKTYQRWLTTLSKRGHAEYIAPSTIVKVQSEVDTVVTFNVAIPYELWMDDAILAVDQEIISYNDDRSLVVFALGGKVKLSPRIPYRVQPLVSFIVPEKEKIKKRSFQGQAFLDFPVGRHTIIKNFRRNPEELEKIYEAFTAIERNSDVEIKGMFIEGYASPEGKYESNERLARERATSLKYYIMKSYKLPITDNQIKVSWVAEDWNGLRALVEESQLALKQKILDIIDSTDVMDAREGMLMRLDGGSIWRAMMSEMFPKLRRVEYQIDFTVKDYSVDEARLLIDRSSDLLSQNELYMSAMSYGRDSHEFENIILDVIPKHYPEDSVAIINSATQMIRRGEIVTAKRILERYPNNPQVWNNLGVIHLMEGNLDEAQAMFYKAINAGVVDAQHNIKEVNRKREDNDKMARYRNR